MPDHPERRPESDPAKDPAKDPASDRVAIRLRVNGVDHDVSVEPRRSLADVLRDDLRLTGTHLGCEHGVCGACTVIAGDRPVRACISYAVQWDGGPEIRTVEGLVTDPVGQQLGEQMSQHHGLQCGFCTPGMMVLGCWALGGNRPIDDKWIEDVVSSNICRCGCYPGIRAAFRAVASEAIARTARADRAATSDDR